MPNRYREVCDSKYNFDAEKGTQKAGHFTQVVWKDSKDIGVGVSNKQNKLKLNCTYVVVRYRNAGNILGLFTDKVQRGSFIPGMCRKIVNMADSAVQEADEGFDQVNAIDNVAKLLGSEASQLGAVADAAQNVGLGTSPNSNQQQVSHQNEIKTDILNGSLVADGLKTTSKENLGLINASLGTVALNGTVLLNHADEAIKKFFESQIKGGRKIKGRYGRPLESNLL